MRERVGGGDRGEGGSEVNYSNERRGDVEDRP